MRYKGENKVENGFEEEFIYLRKNGENLSDPDIIENCKLEQNRDIIENARLGSYDKYGNYIFMPQIRFELINIPKFIYHISKQDNTKIFDLKTIIPIFGELFFKLTVSDKEIVLYLVETVSRESGGYMEVYEEVVDAIAIGNMSKYLLEDIFSMYHIYENDEDEDKKTFFIFDYINLLTRKIYLTLLSKELNEEMQNDEHDIFNSMISILKDGEEYGKKVLSEFMVRLKDRPEIFEMESTQKYNKAVNEVLLSALDIVTTQEDKEKPKSKEIYLNVLNARNKNVSRYIENSHKKVEKEYVQDIAKRAIVNFNENELNQDNQNTEKENEKQKNKELVKDFYDRLVKKQKTNEKRVVKEPVLKKGKEQESKSMNALGALVAGKMVAENAVLSTVKKAVKTVAKSEKSNSIEKKTEDKSATKSSSSANKVEKKSGSKTSSVKKKTQNKNIGKTPSKPKDQNSNGKTDAKSDTKSSQKSSPKPAPKQKPKTNTPAVGEAKNKKVEDKKLTAVVKQNEQKKKNLFSNSPFNNKLVGGKRSYENSDFTKSPISSKTTEIITDEIKTTPAKQQENKVDSLTIEAT